MSTETPARYWTANAMYVRDVQTKIAEKEVVKSSEFFCRQDPHPSTLQFELDFGVSESNYLGVYVEALVRDVPNAEITFCISNDEGQTLARKAETDETRCHMKKNCPQGYAQFFNLIETAKKAKKNMNWRVICEVEYEASLPTKPPSETSNKSLHDDLLKLLESSDNADVTFSVEGEKIKAHKAILAARSAYFKRMFDSGMKEGVSNEVEIQDAKPDVITGMLQYLYSGLPPKNLADIAMGLLAVSDKYGLDELKGICESNIRSNLTAKTVVDALLLAERHSCEDLMNHAQIVFRTNIGALKQSKQDWEKLRSNVDLSLKLLVHFCDN